MKENILYLILGSIIGLGIVYLYLKLDDISQKVTEIHSFLNTQDICQQF